MEPDSNLPLHWLLLLLLTMIHAFFTMCDISMVALNDKKLQKMAQDGDKKADMILRLLKRPSKFTATIQLGLALSSFFMAVIVMDALSPRYLHAFRQGIPHGSGIVSAVLAALVFLLLSIVFGDMVPRKIAVHHFEKIAFTLAPALRFFSTVFKPVVAALSVCSGFLLKLLGIDPDSEPEEVTEEEIRMLLDAGGERGSIEESEKEMIYSIFELDDCTVDDVMTHRTEIVFLEKDALLEEVLATVLKSGHSRIPVCDENGLDSIVGILYVKDLLALMKDDGPNGMFSLQDHMRDPLYVLESNTCTAVLSEFKAKKIHIAIVVDEYGGTSGLVTMEDLLEFIVGNIQDEYDTEEDEEILKLSENRFLVDGLTNLSDIDKYFDLNLSEESEFDTIGGYVIDLLGRIPADGEHPSVEAGGYRFIVSEMDERRVVSLEAEKTDDLTGPGETQNINECER